MVSLNFSVWFFISSSQAAISAHPYNQAYDPFRNPFIDYEQAKRDAMAANKLLLIDVGGDWCIWCKRLDSFLQNNSDISKSMDEAFVLFKVNVSEEQSNLEFFKQFPPVKGYPHFIIVDGNGKYLGEQDTSKLEQGEGYSPARFNMFIAHWHPAKH